MNYRADPDLYFHRGVTQSLPKPKNSPVRKFEETFYMEVEMRKIDNVNKIIYMTKGDSFPLRFPSKDKTTGEEYTLQPGDKITFAVKRKYKDVEPIFSIDSDTYYIDIKPEHTENMAAGKYVFDVQITFADGYVFTYIGENDSLKPKFILWNEVSK